MATPIPDNRAVFSLAEVALATHGTIARRGTRAAEPTAGVFSDSRAVVDGSVYVALCGENHDGHAFVAAAIARGARIVVVDRAARVAAVGDASVVEVDDTLRAWGDLARAHLVKWRIDSVDGRVIAITGSAGKTTTKELTAALLAEVAPTHFTAGNLNNRIGVPAVVFALESKHRFCVLEMGMSLPGELDAITAFARPDVSVVVNVGVAHAEGVGGAAGVEREKGAVYRALGPDGVAIVNADDEAVRRAARDAGVRRIETFGRGTSAAVKKGGCDSRLTGSFADVAGDASEAGGAGVAGGASAPRPAARMDSERPSRPSSDRPSASWPSSRGPHYRLLERTIDPAGGSRVVVSCAGRELTLALPIPGEAAAIDLAAALAAQEAASRELLSPDAIHRALATVRVAGRGVVRALGDGIFVLDDTYNANPASMRSALATLRELGAGRRTVAVLGEMKELGHLAEEEHAALGDAIAEASVALAIGCGGLVDRALERAATRGVDVVVCATTEEAALVAVGRISAGDVVLVKGSRSTTTERVVDALARAHPER